MIFKAPLLYLPSRNGQFYLECDSSAKHVDSVLYQIQNGNKHVIAFYSATMPEAAIRYSSSELAFSIYTEVFIFHYTDGPQCFETHLLL